MLYIVKRDRKKKGLGPLYEGSCLKEGALLKRRCRLYPIVFSICTESVVQSCHFRLTGDVATALDVPPTREDALTREQTLKTELIEAVCLEKQ